MLCIMLFSFTECSPQQLLPCDIPENPYDNDIILCCNENCVQYSGISFGNTASYFTSKDYCFKGSTVRQCTTNMTWDGQIPVFERGTNNTTIFFYIQKRLEFFGFFSFHVCAFWYYKHIIGNSGTYILFPWTHGLSIGSGTSYQESQYVKVSLVLEM